jgi:hypothetical protein
MLLGARDFNRDAGDRRAAITWLITIFVVVLPLMGRVDAQGATIPRIFPRPENPISEGNRWVNGQTTGLDWQNVRTTPGLAFGADASGNPNYNDPTALLTGTWSPNQMAQGTVYSVNQQSGSIYEEVELRLRSKITAHSITGYEILFRCNHVGGWYTDIVRWNGPLGNFTSLSHVTTGPGIFNGDVVKATIIGNVITAYINGVQVNQVTDNTFTSGNPGVGFYLHGIANRNADYGFTSFTASDIAPTAPTNLRITPDEAFAMALSPATTQIESALVRNGAGTSDSAESVATMYGVLRGLNRRSRGRSTPIV